MVLIYVAIILFVVLGLLFSGNSLDKGKKAFLIICFLVMLILHTFVNPEYSDLLGYKYGYQEFAGMSFSDVLKHNAFSLKAEVGYRVFCKILTYISTNWVFALFVISVIILNGYYQTTKKYSPSYLFSVLFIMVGPFMQSTFVLRQHMAMGLLLLTYPFIMERKLMPYMLLCAAAFLLHQTAIIFLPVYFLYNLSKNKFAIVSAVAMVVLATSMSFFLTTAGRYAMGTASYGDYYFARDMQVGTNYKSALLMVVLLIIRVLILKKNFFNEGITRLMSIVLVFGTIFAITGIGYVGTSRMNMYFTAASFLYIPNTFYYLKDKTFRLLFNVGYFLFLLYFFVNNNADFEGIWFISPNI